MTKRTDFEKEIPLAKRQRGEKYEKGVVRGGTPLPQIPFAGLWFASPVDQNMGNHVKHDEFPKVSLQTPDDFSVLKIGRNRKHDIQLFHPDVGDLMSREHAEIAMSPDGMHQLKDLGSYNGTYVNDNLIPTEKEWTLRNGDCISFGGTSRLLKDNKILINPFRFEYYRIHSVEVWCRMTKDVDEKREPTPDLPEWLASEVQCGICFECMENPHSVNNCGHVFCKACLLSWFCRSKACPLCKREIEKHAPSTITPCLPMRILTDRVHSNLSLIEVRQRGKHVRELYTALLKKLSFRLANATERTFFNVAGSEGSSPFGTTRGRRFTSPRVPGAEGVNTTSAVWKATSSNVDSPTLCAFCKNGIPAKLFRITRTSREVTQHFHLNMECVGGRYVSEIKSPAFELKNDGDISEQEDRISTRLFETIRTTRLGQTGFDTFNIFRV